MMNLKLSFFRAGQCAVAAVLFTLLGGQIFAFGQQEPAEPEEAVEREEERGTTSGTEDTVAGSVPLLTGGPPATDADIAEARTHESTELPQEFLNQDPPPRVSAFETDFSRASIDYDQVLAGGPPKDGIPSVDDPQFISISEANEWIRETESVLVFTTQPYVEDGPFELEARIYPIQILMWHEIVNDEVGGLPVSITYCPLCNTGIAFDRRYDGQVLDFGTTGRLRFSNLIMYDRQTETWWQQATGRGVAGRYAGGRLRVLGLLLLPWNEARERFPDSVVMSRETGYNRNYGTNPYSGYDTTLQPFLYEGPEIDDQYNPMDRVLTVFVEDESAGFPYPVLRDDRVVQEEIGGSSVVVMWEEGTASPLDSAMLAEGRDIGTANAFFAEVDGRRLSFRAEGGRILDEETGSEWTVSGRALSGELEGAELDPVATAQHFWFSWTAFEPET